jgi:aspartyl-tRNA(Asn)/glutamyl-tRNA(Gln) amidotransferase subunit A
MVNVPSISIPCGFSVTRLPIGLQIVGDIFKEEKILRIAAAFEGATEFHTIRPPVSCEQTVIT